MTHPDPFEKDAIEFSEFLGTGFLIGGNGYALTAAHVVRKHTQEQLAAMFVGSDLKWFGLVVEHIEFHPTEDIAILKLTTSVQLKSVFRISTVHVHAGIHYQCYECYGYPLDTLYENLSNKKPDGSIFASPDLIYTEGYVRRRLSWDLHIPDVKGTKFIELSDIAGTGCSGSPVFVKAQNGCNVLGIYVGEKTEYTDEHSQVPPRGVAFAVRVEAFSNWAPIKLGHRVKVEAQGLDVD